MAKIKPKKANSKEIFNGFPGISAKKEVFGHSAADMRNFRILPDGSLEKRCGWQVFIPLVDRARAYWNGSIDGNAKSFAVVGPYVYCVTPTSMKLVSELDSDTGDVSFFMYKNTLFLLTGSNILSYRTSTDTFEEALGYAPLYGYNWHPTNMGDVNEPLNLFSRRIRVHYLNTTGSTDFNLPFFAERVDEVRVNGVVSKEYNVIFYRYLNITTSSPPETVEIAYKISSTSDLQSQLLQSRYAFCANNEEHEDLVLFGSPNGNLLFCATEINQNQLNASKAIYPSCDALYITKNKILTLGNTEQPIHSLYAQHDRILAFHATGAYSVHLAKDGSDTVEYYPLLEGMGCTANNMSLYLDGDPIVINASGIFRLHSLSGEPNEFSITEIGEGLDVLKSSEFYENVIACENSAYNELWFASSTDEEGRVWIYQMLEKVWYCFDHISPTFFFQHNNKIGFATGSHLCIFNENLTKDRGMPFSAVYKTDYLVFSYPEHSKRALYATLCAQTKSEDLSICVESEHASKTYSLRPDGSDAPQFFDRRVPLGRFRFLRVTLTDSGTSRSRFNRLALFANL